MPVVNTANFVDRLREITSRVNPRESLQNTKQRLQTSYAAMSVGNAAQVQEFYKYVKVYPQCPANDLLFMSMTAQLSRAAMFPTDKMFKQMWKLEKHMDTLLLKEGYIGIYGSRAIEILACQNHKFILKFRKYKHRQEKKRFSKESKKSKKDAKVLAAIRDARMRARSDEMKKETLQQILHPEPIPNIDIVHNYYIPNHIIHLKPKEVSPPVEILSPQRDHLDEKREVLHTKSVIPNPDFGSGSGTPPEHAPCPTPDGTDTSGLLKQKFEEAGLSNAQLEDLLTDMVAKIITKNKLELAENPLDKQDVDNSSSDSDDGEEEEEEEEATSSCGFFAPEPVEVITVQEEPESEEDELEKIDEHDVEALEYEML